MRFALLWLLAAMAAEAADTFLRPGADTPSPVVITNLIPQTPPRPKTPVELFRDLLAMSPRQRAEQLAQKPAAQRQYLLAKLLEYEALPLAEREKRLAQLQVRWYLRPLLESSPEKREPLLRYVPAQLQPVIEKRLRLWEGLEPSLQKKILANGWMTSYIFRANPPEPPRLPAAPPPDSAGLSTKLAQWDSLPEARRRDLAEQFERFLVLSPDEKERTLEVLPEKSRRQTEQTLRRLENLTAEERRDCLEAFEQFSGMSPPERDQFFQNAQRWLALSDEERDVWRRLVKQIPPLPPGFRIEVKLPPGIAPSSPPSPPRPRPGRSVPPPLPGLPRPPLPPLPEGAATHSPAGR